MATKRKSAPPKTARKTEDLIDEVGRETFPASDPPSYAGGGTFVGAPARRSKDKRARRAPAVKKRK